jgi:beta-1,2-mannobiose phosphorylase / 1,2-beta-oligomannan phosphorylase
VQFNEAGDPADVERLCIALEPETDYERRPRGGGGCEDARVTFVEPFGRYIMTYTAYSHNGPRIALAQSQDLFDWQRMGLATFAQWRGVELGDEDDKDASFFPVAIHNPSVHPELAMQHRPLFSGTRPKETACETLARMVDLNRESIWISYCCPTLEKQNPDRLGRFTSHRRLATPVVSLGAAQDRCGNSACPHPSWLADPLSRRE